jgi:hypothetical protein
MAGRQAIRAEKQTFGQATAQEGNLGQKEARREKEKEAKLSRMGEMSRDDERRRGKRSSK